jgi:hypothetical protein
MSYIISFYFENYWKQTWNRLDKAELEPVQNYQTGPVRPVTGRFKKCFRPVKTGRYFQAIYLWLKKVAPKNTRLRIFCRVFVSIDFCNNISWTCTCTRHNLLRKESISRNLWSSFLIKAWGRPRGNLLNTKNLKPLKTGKNRPVQSFQPVRFQLWDKIELPIAGIEGSVRNPSMVIFGWCKNTSWTKTKASTWLFIGFWS